MSVSKMIMGQAANQYVAPTYVENVFSTHLYTGNSSTRTITNDIDLSGKGGLVWIKDRDSGSNSHLLYDTERGAYNALKSNDTSVNQTRSTGLTGFTSSGFTLGSLGAENGSSNDKVSWTWRKQPKFFDIVTYTGDGNADRQINHNLGSVPGMMIVKKYAGSTTRWAVYHRSLGTGKFLNLDDTASTVTQNDHWQTAPNATQFTVETNGNVNNSGDSYVAYLFAHHDGDGDFGLTNDQDIIKCGSYTGNAGTQSIDVGFEPQWIIIKNTDGATDWSIVDAMRGMPVGENAKRLMANNANAEQEAHKIDITPTGFHFPNEGSDQVNANGNTYIYMAIRRGPMDTPTSATDVFALDQLGQTSPSPPAFTSGFAVDKILFRGGLNANGQNPRVFDRLRGSQELNTNNTNAETSNTFSYYEFDYSNGVGSNTGTATDLIMYMWKRAPGYFDVVAYDGGNGSSINHNLGVTPEMYWIKCRSDGSTNRGWAVYHKDATTQASQYLRLDTNDALISLGVFNNGTIDASTFSANNGYSIVNESGQTYIAHLFATVEGISKAGSYTSNGAQQNIDCGFSSGARFVLVKRTDGIGHWVLFDATRGITANSDPHLRLNDNVAQDTDGNIDIEPYSSGFTVNYGSNNLNNNTGQTYIFYAIA